MLQILTVCRDLLRQAISAAVDLAAAYLSTHHSPTGILARTWPTGSMVLWVAVLLGVYLLLYFP